MAARPSPFGPATPKAYGWIPRTHAHTSAAEFRQGSSDITNQETPRTRRPIEAREDLGHRVLELGDVTRGAARVGWRTTFAGASTLADLAYGPRRSIGIGAQAVWLRLTSDRRFGTRSERGRLRDPGRLALDPLSPAGGFGGDGPWRPGSGSDTRRHSWSGEGTLRANRLGGQRADSALGPRATTHREPLGSLAPLYLLETFGGSRARRLSGEPAEAPRGRPRCGLGGPALGHWN